MLVKNDFAPMLTKQNLFSQSQKYFATILHQPAIKGVFRAGQGLLTIFAVVSGIPDTLENLDKLGISLGPSHE